MNKLFGDNQFNFYGWFFATIVSFFVGLILFLNSCGYYGKAFREGIAMRSPEGSLLAAIYFVLLAILWVLSVFLCLALQNYFVRVSKTIEEQKAKKDGKPGV